MLFLLIIFSSQYFAQELITDRPDQTESAVTVPIHSLQIETGFAYEKFQETRFINFNKATFTINNYSIAGTLLRYGIFENIELRFGAGYLINKAEISNSGFGDFLFGTKINFLTEENSIVDLGLLIHAALPIGDESFNPKYAEPELIASISKSISDKFSIGVNLGGFHDSSIESVIFIYTTALGISLNDKLGSFLEVFGNYFPANIPVHNFDGGFTYLLSNTVQLDISGGKGISGIDSFWFISGGVSARIDTL